MALQNCTYWTCCIWNFWIGNLKKFYAETLQREYMYYGKTNKEYLYRQVCKLKPDLLYSLGIQ